MVHKKTVHTRGPLDPVLSEHCSGQASLCQPKVVQLEGPGSKLPVRLPHQLAAACFQGRQILGYRRGRAGALPC